MPEIVELSEVIVGAVLAMCMFSTLYGKSSPMYSLAEESYIGFATGLTIVVNVLFIYNTGILGVEAGDWILAFGLLLGLMVVVRIYPKYSYISRLPIAITFGAGLGIGLRTTIFTGFLQQITGTITQLFAGSLQTLIYNWTIAICVLFTIPFFLYTVELRGALGSVAKFGEYLLYIGFGASFAVTFMGRLALFVGFMQYYTIPSWKIPILILSMVGVLALIIVLDKTNLLERLTPEE